MREAGPPKRSVSVAIPASVGATRWFQRTAFAPRSFERPPRHASWPRSASSPLAFTHPPGLGSSGGQFPRS